jgi:hypothetical protein
MKPTPAYAGNGATCSVRLTRPTNGGRTAHIGGIELVHMLQKRQLAGGIEHGPTAAEQFYSLAA